jgi:hypothetical protein
MLIEINTLQTWKSGNEKNVEKIPGIAERLNNIDDLLIDEDNTISLAKLGTITNLFDFNEEGNVVRANINPGEYICVNTASEEESEGDSEEKSEEDYIIVDVLQ